MYMYMVYTSCTPYVYTKVYTMYAYTMYTVYTTSFKNNRASTFRSIQGKYNIAQSKKTKNDKTELTLKEENFNP